MAVASGRARYVGLSNFCGWQLAKAATWQLAAPGVRTRLASTQMEYSLLQRGVEREVLPAALDLGMGLLPVLPARPRRAHRQVPARHPAGLAGRLLAAGPLRRALPGRRRPDASWTPSPPRPTAWPSPRCRWRWPGCGTGRASPPPIVGARTSQQLTDALSVESLRLPDEISPGARRCLGARAPLSRPGLERAVTSQDKAAELLAAVKAVESGERSAASFFTEPAPAAAGRARPPAAPARPRPGAPDGQPAPQGRPAEVHRGAARGAGRGRGARGAGAGGRSRRSASRPAEVLRDDPWQLLAVPGRAARAGRRLRPRAAGRRVRPGRRAPRAGAGRPAAGARGTSRGTPPWSRPRSPRAWSSTRCRTRTRRCARRSRRARCSSSRTRSTPRPPQRPAAVRTTARRSRSARCGCCSAWTATRWPRRASPTASPGWPPPSPPARRQPAAGLAGSDGPPRRRHSPSAGELIRAAAGHGLVTHTGGETARAEPAALVAAARALGLRACAATHSATERQRVPV